MTGKFYHTGRSPRALWQRFRLRRAYRRPVTFEDLRRIAYDAEKLEERGLPAAQALFYCVIRQSELPVFPDRPFFPTQHDGGGA